MENKTLAERDTKSSQKITTDMEFRFTDGPSLLKVKTCNMLVFSNHDRKLEAEH